MLLRQFLRAETGLPFRDASLGSVHVPYFQDPLSAGAGAVDGPGVASAYCNDRCGLRAAASEEGHRDGPGADTADLADLSWAGCK